MSDKLTQNAAEQFRAKKFSQCVETTKKIMQLSKGKPESSDLHNLAVASFCADGFRDPMLLLKQLLKLVPSSQDSRSITEENCVVLYNIALIEYGLKQYRTALTRIEPVFSSISSLSDYLGIKVSFLLLDIYLVLGKQHCNVIQSATQVLDYLQNYFNLLKKNSSAGNEKKGNKKGNNKNSKQQQQQQDKSKDDSSNDTFTMDPTEFKYHYHLYRAKFFVFNNILNQATREIKCCMTVSNQSAQPLFLKSNLENLKENYDKSVKILNAIQGDTSDPTLPALYFNNIGIIHFQLKKYEAAGYYFARAIKENESIYDVKDDNSSTTTRIVTLDTFVRDRRSEILYNTGLLHLLAGKPEIAFECFQGSSLIYYKDPRLWLRLAECCVASHTKVVEDEYTKKSLVTPVNVPNHVTGNGDSDTVKLMIKQPNRSNGLSFNEDDAPENLVFTGSSFGKLSLEYAEKCLRSCLYLCRRILSKFPEGSDINSTSNDTNTSTSTTVNSSSFNLQMTKDELDTIRQAALANLAFVSLATNNPKLTITCAKNLLLSKRDGYSLFAHFYTAEAYCMLDCTNEALMHLPIHEEFPTDLDSPYFQQPYSASVRYSLLHNVVVTHILREDFNQAQIFLSKALLACPPQCLPRAMLLQVYLELQTGNRRMALQLLQKGRKAPTTQILGKRQDSI